MNCEKSNDEVGMLAFSRRNKRTNSAVTRKVRQGGKYTGEGTYGCGYAPALRCKGETKRKFGLFTKLMDEEEARKEEGVATFLRPIDPNQKYILYPVKVCEVNEDVLGPDNPENNIDSCQKDFAPDDLHLARAVQYIDGGSDLRKVIVTASSFTDFFQGIENLFHGLFYLHQANISHNDIKPDNVVAKMNGNGDFTIRYIDVGFVQENDKKILYDKPFMAEYYVWPYEMRYTIENKNATVNSINSWVRIVKYSYMPTEIFVDHTGVNTLTPAIMNAYIEKMRDDLKKKYPPSPATAASGPTTHKKFKYEDMIRAKMAAKILDKVDIYSLGGTLCYIYDRFVRHQMHHEQIMVFLEKKNKYVLVDSLDTEPLDPETIQWHKDVAEHISKPFYNLCKKMMNVNPAKRATLPIALHAYKKILPSMSKYFKADKILRHLDGVCVRKGSMENNAAKRSP